MNPMKIDRKLDITRPMASMCTFSSTKERYDDCPVTIFEAGSVAKMQPCHGKSPVLFAKLLYRSHISKDVM